MNSLGRHILVELYGCEEDILSNTKLIQQEMENAADIAGATRVGSNFHTFSPYGVSGVVVIAESHLTIHTWPELGYAALDLFTCGDSVNPWTAFEHLEKVFKAYKVQTQEIKRGSVKDAEENPAPVQLCAVRSA
ncbi:adenosylmethionine decarboxylase [Limisalsivibrio acetivorans]|uniref:adenosylmethionine decarboxylase n=1 Tax=Limisalsivibrio acetivorans TaxID=1304888 RepID=UPI0003B4A36E|nr:adenosylmethionine decarboxylase [Limisalsivibrio acetivorans]